MKKLLCLAVLWSSCAGAVCTDVWDPMNEQWVYDCTDDISEPRLPVCTPTYDPLNNVWVMVCQ